MFTRVLIGLAVGVGLAACQPTVPDSGRGVGFDDYEAQARRDAALATSVPAPAAVTSTALPAEGSAAATAAQARQVLAATAPNGTEGQGTSATNSGEEPLNASPSNPAPAVIGGDGISRENNFDAVAAQRTREGDAERIDANRAQYQLVQPEALPDRGQTGPNIVAYALANTHAPGTRIYTRFGLNKAARYQRVCAKYPRSDRAQLIFLENGGPQRDRLGMDPDGDGFACDWDPAPFRQATSG